MKKNIFTLVMVTVVVALIWGAWILTMKYINRGEDLNKKAWEASYRERKLPVPYSGPREGYWGGRLGSKVRDGQLVWREPEIHLPGLVDIDGFGRQYYRNPGANRRQILILGGSVAFGANASGISKTYFNILGAELERRGMPTEIAIVAAGAWKSAQEVRALKLYLQQQQPDLVVFLNGLNDLTNGSTSRTLYGEPTATKDGSPWTVLYHEHDYEQRVADYLGNMQAAREMSTAKGIDMLIVLQPSLHERSRRTPIENRILDLSLEPHSSLSALSESYTSIRKRLTVQARNRKVFFLDCSNALDAEKQTVFTDIWHFTDFGHRVIAEGMADTIAGILVQKSVKGK